MQDEIFEIPLDLPGSLSGAKDRIIADFRAEGISVIKERYYVAKAAGPPPEVNFWIDLANHAKEYPIEHIIDSLEGALALALLQVLKRLRNWLTSNPRLQLVLPGSKHRIQYVIPDGSEAGRAINAIKKHYKAVRDESANEYFWKNGKWTSAKEHFESKRA